MVIAGAILPGRRKAAEFEYAHPKQPVHGDRSPLRAVYFAWPGRVQLIGEEPGKHLQYEKRH